jgi:site-specific recombinase XerD
MRYNGLMPITNPGDKAAVRKYRQYLDMKGRAARTMEERENALRRLAVYLADIPLLEASADDLYGWRASLHVSDSTVAVYVSNVRSFFRWAHETGLLAEDPSADIPAPAYQQGLPRPISSSELSHALSLAGTHLRPMLVLASGCGMRVKEIAGLRAENVRLHDDPPVILIESRATKGHRERAIPLSAFVLAEFAIAGLPPAHGPVFPDANGHHFTPWQISKICNAHLRACGTSSTMHTLRHWFGTQAYGVGNDLLAVKELLGHANVQTTAGYASLNRRRTAEVVNAMPAPGAPLMREVS